MVYTKLEDMIIASPLEFLNEGQESFDQLGEISGELKKGNVNSPEVISEVLKKVTGIYLFLSPRCSIARTTKLNEENREYIDYKIRTEEDGDKFVSAVAERHAKKETAVYRRIENAYDGYLETCKTVINVCQSLLRFLKEEKDFSKSVEV